MREVVPYGVWPKPRSIVLPIRLASELAPVASIQSRDRFAEEIEQLLLGDAGFDRDVGEVLAEIHDPVHAAEIDQDEPSAAGTRDP